MANVINGIYPSEHEYALAYFAYLARVGRMFSLGKSYQTHPTEFKEFVNRPKPGDYGVIAHRANTVRKRVEAMVKYANVKTRQRQAAA
jgi:hypothetical protein